MEARYFRFSPNRGRSRKEAANQQQGHDLAGVNDSDSVNDLVRGNRPAGRPLEKTRVEQSSVEQSRGEPSRGEPSRARISRLHLRAVAADWGAAAAIELPADSPLAGEHQINQRGTKNRRHVKNCEWCGDQIPLWRIVGYFREPPLCSRKCVSDWSQREL